MSNRFVDRGTPSKGVVTTTRDSRQPTDELRAAENYSFPDGKPIRRQGHGFYGDNETRIQGQQLTKQTPVMQMGILNDEDTSVSVNHPFSQHEKTPNSYGLIRWHADFQPLSTRDWTVEFLLTIGEEERLVASPEERNLRLQYVAAVDPGRPFVRQTAGVYVFDQTIIATYCDFNFDDGGGAATRNLRPPTFVGDGGSAQIQTTDTLALSALAIGFRKTEIFAHCTLIDTGEYFPFKVDLSFTIGTYTPGTTYHVGVRYTNSSRILDLVIDGTSAATYTLLAGEKFAGEEDDVNNAASDDIERDIVLLNECTVRGAYASTAKLAHIAQGVSKFNQRQIEKTEVATNLLISPAGYVEELSGFEL